MTAALIGLKAKSKNRADIIHYEHEYALIQISRLFTQSCLKAVINI